MSQSTLQLSRDELAGLLHSWVFRCIDGPQIGTFSNNLSLDIDDAEDYYSVRQLLLVLNMWLVVTGCQSRLQGWSSLYDCIQLFHHLVYEKNVRGDEDDYVRWLKWVTCGYDDYDRAMMAANTPARVLGVARIVGKSMWGDIKKNPLAIFKIGSYITDHYQHLTEFVGRCDVH